MFKRFRRRRGVAAHRRRPSLTHPRNFIYDYPYVNSGFEGALYRVKRKGVLHKFWRQAWILANYPMYENGARIFKRASIRARKRFSSGHGLEIKENKEVPHVGLPIEQFKRITFVLSFASEDLLRQAREVHIPVPPIARAIKHPKKDLYILELSDLSIPGHIIVSGNEFSSSYQKKAANFKQVIAGMKEDLRKLKQLGYEEDSDTHPQYSAWLVRINKKTMEAGRFLWDPTNLRISADYPFKR